MTFDDFDLDPRCVDLLREQGIETPTPIQEQAIPIAMTGADLVGTAQTGTGKTLGFSLPGMTRIAKGDPKYNQMLVLVPTRELCTQVHRVIDDLGTVLGLRSVAIYGGVGIHGQADKLRDGVHIIVATPGRLLDHIERKNIRFSHLDILIFDEADRMLDMGFLPDIQRIVSYLPKKRQTLMFSATFPPEIERFARSMMDEPERIKIGTIAKPVDSVTQALYPVRQEKKASLLVKILEEEDPGPTLIFLRTKQRTERLAQVLKRNGYKIAQIHGDRSQIQRQQALDGFRSGKYTMLVATDVASRGLDIEGVSHVINYDLPQSPDDYIHRIGRTARAQTEGDAITFVSPDEFQALGAIERTLEYNIPRTETEDAPAVISVFKPKEKGRKKGGASRRSPRTMGRRR